MGKRLEMGRWFGFAENICYFLYCCFLLCTFILNVIKDMLLMKKQMHVYLLLLFLLVKIVEQ